MKNSYINLINDKLNEYIDSCYPKIIYDSMKYSLMSGGKRTRSSLLLKTCKCFNGKLEDAIHFACAVEMIHAYSLIHDDLPAMDDDDFRRGKLSNHKVYGEAIAILTGDALLNLAYEIMFKFCSKKIELSYILAAEEISYASGVKGMIGGQVADILSEGKNIDNKTLLYIHKNKTAELIKASMVSGAIIANASKENIYKIKEIGYLLGIAFQIKDDLLDIQSTSDILGKPIKSDIKNNKSTYVNMYGIDKAEKDLNKYTNEAIKILEKIDIKSYELKEFILNLLNRKN